MLVDVVFLCYIICGLVALRGIAHNCVVSTSFIDDPIY